MSSALVRRLLHTESKWNPKVIVGRVVMAVLPDSAIYRLRKQWAYMLLKRRPESEMEQDAAMVAKLIGPQDTVFDIGANYGSFARFMAARVAKVIAFEPIPQTYDFLTNNMRKLKLGNVECLPFALSETNEDQEMVIPQYQWGTENFYDARVDPVNSGTRVRKPHWKRIPVQCRTLDSLNLPPITFVKCDANYHELAVLKGGIETIRKYKPAMLIEVQLDPDDPKTIAHATFELLRGEGYEGYIYNGESLFMRKPGQRSQNYFFLRPEHVERLPESLRYFD